MESGTLNGNNINVGRIERWISTAVGGALIYFGMRRRSWLGSLLAFGGGNLIFRGVMGKSLVYRAFGLSTARQATGKTSIRVEKSVLVGKSPDEIYRYWRNLENLPRIMGHLKEVRNIDDRTSHWVAQGPAGLEVEWDAEITEDQENRRIGWRSLSGSDVGNRGAVIFEPTPDGSYTEVRVSMEYEPPAGKAGAALAKLFGQEPNKQIEDDLQRFKTRMESGEIAPGQMARG